MNTQLTLKLTTGIIIGWLTTNNAWAAPAVGDFFSHNPSESSKTLTPASGSLTPVKWFESFDDLTYSHFPTPGDLVILGRPANQEVERVQQWESTAAKVAKNYRTLAKALQILAVPAAMKDVKEFRDLTADWYNDAAEIYEDLLRPGPPARTKEELAHTLNDIQDRAKALAQTKVNLKQMDSSLRKTYEVHIARQDDALQQYIHGK